MAISRNSKSIWWKFFSGSGTGHTLQHGDSTAGTKISAWKDDTGTEVASMTREGVLTAGGLILAAATLQTIAASGPLVLTTGKTFYPVSSTASGGALTGATIPNGTTGQILILQGTSATDTIRFDDAGTLKLGGNRVLALNSVLTLIFDGTNWNEISFIANG